MWARFAQRAWQPPKQNRTMCKSTTFRELPLEQSLRESTNLPRLQCGATFNTLMYVCVCVCVCVICVCGSVCFSAGLRLCVPACLPACPFVCVPSPLPTALTLEVRTTGRVQSCFTRYLAAGMPLRFDKAERTTSPGCFIRAAQQT